VERQAVTQIQFTKGISLTIMVTLLVCLDGSDQDRSGRKRAAVAHNINPDRSCEWRWKKNCGGGVYPIIGCLTGMQEHRHHGPVKNTARNEVSNVHLICTSCHNRWHTLNDPDYDETANELLPHNPTPATLKECTDNEIKWKSSKVKK
jgi:hypothetical protein